MATRSWIKVSGTAEEMVHMVDPHRKFQPRTVLLRLIPLVREYSCRRRNGTTVVYNPENPRLAHETAGEYMFGPGDDLRSVAEHFEERMQMSTNPMGTVLLVNPGTAVPLQHLQLAFDQRDIEILQRQIRNSFSLARN